MNVIFHIDETDKWPTVLSNIKHMVDWYQKTDTQGDIELLINGEAVEQTVKTANINLNDIYAPNVNIVVCNNSLTQRHISNDDLQEVTSIAPVGVVELALKQQQGYSYIKP
ncbi:DsrE family protein [Leuconostoc gelidum subsp. aenigmaticum]|uniref:DsrE family protein n=1 Tax=Leuconostoc gelidum TaxID=1244 RepID=UPI001CC5215E|nr:DsrE family protein [Leuconostoc gelidum]MBZ6004166.1 DsrE family protein [Leuconostoc gelidum subsp. aenigmaticum]